MKRKSLTAIIITILTILLLTGCSGEANKVSANLSQEADNFNIVRRVTVINCFSDTVVLQLEGKVSIHVDAADQQLEITIENEDGTYSKEFVGLNDFTTYTVEQIGSATTNKYKYRLNFNPKMILPLEPVIID
jgi:uncharacterized lipoprotein YajG